jgi:putative Mg2+ transporter-C (MgtC) family protein
MFLQPEDLIKLTLAIFAGGLIGIEREFRDKAAGFRTIIFICVGAALFTMLSLKLAGDRDHTRIMANIVSGVGFLGAGVILREGGRVVGLTTAAAIWLTAAVGMGVGGGQYVLVGLAVALVMIVLWIFPTFEHWIDNIREDRTYEVTCALKPHTFNDLSELFRSCKLRIHTHRQVKSEDQIICTMQAIGSMKAHEKLVEQLIADENVIEFHF